ncbi:hypothetical protein GFM09_31580 [Rhizobium leguminosarum bv. viciae]|uniref:hypothetical protein n=1 Tax=Rhizobium leguminosarum TaxID=384 RepID=UPI001442960D|nr:hypothetical protein [Rhizobium leguminosarum]MBY5473318.1 hypothetical protein [Rhizobium leguminosarum]NKL73710.1 hypothetical protein [Rhizobium leguminosarum bv. viciae]
MQRFVVDDDVEDHLLRAAALILPWHEEPEALSMGVPIPARTDFDGELRAFRLEFLVRAVFEMVVEEQGAILSSKQPRFKIVA